MAEQKKKQPDLLGPILLIAVGIILLLNTQGILSWSVWWDILRLWPVFLIAAGLDLLIGRRSAWGSLIVALLVVTIMAGALWVATTGSEGRGLDGQQIQYPLGDAAEAQVSIQPAIGTLTLNALPESADLIQGTAQLAEGEEIDERASRQDDRITYRLNSGGEAWMPMIGWDPGRLWDLGLSPGAALEIDTMVAMGSQELDLTGLDVSALNTSMGMGSIEIVLPAKGRFEGDVGGAIGRIEIVVPQGMGLRVNAGTALVARQLPGDFVEMGDGVYTSPGYATAQHRIDLDASLAIGSLRVRYQE